MNIKRKVRNLLRPLSLRVAERISVYFSLALICESILLGTLWLWLLGSSDSNPWVSALGYVVLAILTPLCLIQVIDRMFPRWSESLDFKYLLLSGLLLLWLAGAQAKGVVSSIFQVKADHFPSALSAAIFFEAGTWGSLICIVASLFIYSLVLISSPVKLYGIKAPRNDIAGLRVGSLLLAMAVSLIFVGFGYNGAMRNNVRQLLAAQIAWDVDLVDAPDECLSKEQKEDQKSKVRKWKMLPRSMGDTEVFLVQGAINIPQKAPWHFTDEEAKRFSTFNTRHVKCDADLVVRDNLSAFETHWRNVSKYLVGVNPIGTVALEKGNP